MYSCARNCQAPACRTSPFGSLMAEGHLPGIASLERSRTGRVAPSAFHLPFKGETALNLVWEERRSAWRAGVRNAGRGPLLAAAHPEHDLTAGGLVLVRPLPPINTTFTTNLLGCRPQVADGLNAEPYPTSAADRRAEAGTATAVNDLGADHALAPFPGLTSGEATRCGRVRAAGFLARGSRARWMEGAARGESAARCQAPVTYSLSPGP